jgi:5-methylcytosine-specific restriction protein B
MKSANRVSPNESAMRADPGKQRKYEGLRKSPLFATVVEANRAYLGAAVDDAADTEAVHWVLTCRPSSLNRLSAISMKGMETFVPGETASDDGLTVSGFINSARSPVENGYGTVASFGAKFPELAIDKGSYRDGGDDQMRIWGDHHELVAALSDESYALGVRALAERLMLHGTPYTRFHNYQLADHVLGRR